MMTTTTFILLPFPLTAQFPYALHYFLNCIILIALYFFLILFFQYIQEALNVRIAFYFIFYYDILFVYISCIVQHLFP